MIEILALIGLVVVVVWLTPILIALAARLGIAAVAMFLWVVGPPIEWFERRKPASETIVGLVSEIGLVLLVGFLATVPASVIEPQLNMSSDMVWLLLAIPSVLLMGWFRCFYVIKPLRERRGRLFLVGIWSFCIIIPFSFYLGVSICWAYFATNGTNQLG